jgi:hypothetical protein
MEKGALLTNQSTFLRELRNNEVNNRLMKGKNIYVLSGKRQRSFRNLVPPLSVPFMVWSFGSL